MEMWLDASNSWHIDVFASLIREIHGEHETTTSCGPLAKAHTFTDSQCHQNSLDGKQNGGGKFENAYGHSSHVPELMGS